jgi:signal transduction histidine kinase
MGRGDGFAAQLAHPAEVAAPPGVVYRFRLAIERCSPSGAGTNVTNRLRGRLLLLVFAAIAPVIVFSTFVAMRVAKQERAALEQMIVNRTDHAAQRVNAELRNSVTALEVLGLSSSLMSGDLAEFHAVATRIVRSRDAWENVQVLGPGGEHLANARVPFGTPLPPLNHPEFAVRTAKLRRPIVSDMVSAALAGRMLTVIYVPVIHGDSVRYVLSAAIEPTNWRSVLEVPGSPVEATLFDRQGALVTSTSGSALLQPKALSESLAAASSTERPVSLLQDALGPGNHAYGTHRETTSGWRLVAYMPAHAVESSARKALGALAAGFAVLLVAGILLAAAVGGRLTFAISRLVDSLHAVGRGEAPTPVPTNIVELREASDALATTASLLAERQRLEHEAGVALQEANRSKDHFLAVIAHELRNCIAPIRQSAAIMRLRNFESSATEVAVPIIERQGAQLSRLVEDLLDVTRMDRGKLKLRLERLDLRQLVNESASDHRTMLEEKGIALNVELEHEPVWVCADPTRIRQVIGNLLGNALKFTGNGGTVSVTLTTGDAECELCIADDGAGIDASVLERIFDPFVQGATALAGGLGLGLALAKGLADLHGGRIEAHSDGPGCGSRFILRLPIFTSAPQTAESARGDGALAMESPRSLSSSAGDVPG